MLIFFKSQDSIFYIIFNFDIFTMIKCKKSFHLYKDTDNLINEIQNNDAYEEVIKKDIVKVGTSGYFINIF